MLLSDDILSSASLLFQTPLLVCTPAQLIVLAGLFRQKFELVVCCLVAPAPPVFAYLEEKAEPAKAGLGCTSFRVLDTHLTTRSIGVTENYFGRRHIVLTHKAVVPQIHCTGNETRLSSCVNTGYGAVRGCKFNMAAGVICYNEGGALCRRKRQYGDSLGTRCFGSQMARNSFAEERPQPVISVLS